MGRQPRLIKAGDLVQERITVQAVRRAVFIFFVLALTWLVIVGVLLGNQYTTEPPKKQQVVVNMVMPTVKIFFSRVPDSLNDTAQVFPVERVVTTQAIESFALSQLIAGPTLPERVTGLFSEWNALYVGPPMYTTKSGCHPVATPGDRDFDLIQNMQGAMSMKGQVTLHLCREITQPDAATRARVKADIQATLFQFSAVKGVTIMTAQGDVF